MTITSKATSTARRPPRRWAAAALRALLVLAVSGVVVSDAKAEPKREPLVVIVHPKNPVSDLTKSHLAAVFLRKHKSWPKGKPALVINAPARAPLRVAFDRQLLGFTPAQAADYWIDYRIRGHGRPPPSVRSASVVLRLVARQVGAVGYLPRSVVDKASVKVKQLKVDGLRPGDAGYPLAVEVGK